ncbi:hypothetical protein N0V88_003610 [Collariella sp. IMI 366227]|nr:hypothetical protein N0V88_003610 [Collariella sp. IMI 366227]
MLTPLNNPCPATLEFTPEKLTFGIIVTPGSYMPKNDVVSLRGDLQLKFTADFKKMKLMIHFPLIVRGERQYYRMDIKFSIIKAIHHVAGSGGPSSLVIATEDPPIFRKKQAPLSGEPWAERLSLGEDQFWRRVVDIRPSAENPHAKPVSTDEKPYGIDLGQWTTYWLDLGGSGIEWAAIESHLQDWNIRTRPNTVFTRIEDRKPELRVLLADSVANQVAASKSWNDDLALLSPTAQISLPFDVRYQLEVCLSRGILSEYNIGRDFLEKLVDMLRPDGLDPNRARLVLEYAADQGKPVYNPMDLFQDHAALTYYPTTLHIPDYCVLMRRAIVTPTRIVFSTPTVETTNRIIRRYSEVQDHFLRIQFTDELLEGRVKAGDFDQDDDVLTRVYQVMLHGIKMGSWRWQFLAFGNSQVREHAGFFLGKQEGHQQTITCDYIRQQMGNFAHISSVAKYAARLGQCFSTTRLLRCSTTIVKTSDVEKGGYCFTDGVGKISQSLAGLIAENWGIRSNLSAFQFRMGGCKGILVTWPDAKGLEVHIRPSQEKFPAEYKGLEIVRLSQFSCATLNRQTISILSCLGVCDEVFIDLMRQQLVDYDLAMTDKDKAIELLTSYVDENMSTTTIATMLLDGFLHTGEPFVRTLLQLWKSWSLKSLREKARLVVDQGAFVLGCADETGTLRGHSRLTEGRANIPRDQLPQIFLQVPDPKNQGMYKIITGLCLVGRNPSLHPGDIRVVEAVDVPQLRHLRDVVVFPLHGDRDVPSMCSGGDLDGDDFFIIWDSKLLPTEWSHPPMNYTAPSALVEPMASSAKSLATFFVLFMKNDRLGQIALAHLATADFEPEGAKHRKCLELAQLHSTAVDYVKSGVPAIWNKKLEPRKYPHFMERAKGRSYHSSNVLGKLYDMVGKAVFDNHENYTLPFDDRILKRYHLPDPLLKHARRVKTQYDIAMRRIMGQLEIRTEFEVYTSFVLSKPKVGSDYKTQERVGREAHGLRQRFRSLCLTTVEEQGFDQLEFVAAMYRVTWEETRIALYEARQKHVRLNGTVGLRRVTHRSMPLISFPWLFPTEMGKIAMGAEERLSLVDIRANPQQQGLLSRPKGRAAVVVNTKTTEIDLQGMDYTKTSDGQYVHRGEILHLFRHDYDDEREEGFYLGQDDEVQYPVDFKGEKGMDDGDLLLDLETGVVGASSGSEAASPVHQTASSPPKLPSPFPTGSTPSRVVLIDLLSSDLDDNISVSPFLTPTKVNAQHQQQQINPVAKPVSAPNKAKLDSTSPIPTQAVPAPGSRLNPRNSITPSTAVKANPNTKGISHQSQIQRDIWIQNNIASDAPNCYLIGGSLLNEIQGRGAGERGRAVAGGLFSYSGQSQLGGFSGSVEASRDLSTENGGEDGAEKAKSDEDGGIEYEEEVIEVEAETALERAARLGLA